MSKLGKPRGRPNGRPQGAYRPTRDRWGAFPDLFASHIASGSGTEAGALPILAIADRRVLSLHPGIGRALARRATVVAMSGGEQAKTLTALERILRAATGLPRGTVVLAIGGGSIGDVATVAAHLIKRGLPLLHVPTTLLAAVDSSVGGKGAVHVAAGRHEVKNAAGVFHYPVEGWICPELLATLSARQVFEGEVEAYKMAAGLDVRAWRRYAAREPAMPRLIRDARALKGWVCAHDPYEDSDLRKLLNFGHTFGHLLESLTDFRFSHGEAVCLGICCALDVGRELGVTPENTALEVEGAFAQLWQRVHARSPRAALARALADVRKVELQGLLAADKKARSAGGVRMVLLTDLGQSGVFSVPSGVWQKLWRDRWRAGTP